jgi:hypothetical protein
MLQTVTINLSPVEIIKAVKKMKKRERDAFLEDLLASTAPEYLHSIREARADYKSGNVNTHEDVLGK